MDNIRNIIIVAGEASGDLHGANLVGEIRKLNPAIRFSGIGGDKMMEAGVNLVRHVREMAVIGIFEVFEKLSFFRNTMKELTDMIRVMKPEAVILIDFPDFNMRLGARASRLGCKVVYYISPQVWAWRKGRVKTIADIVDKMLVAFPFEVDIYKKAGVDVSFVGHPLMDVVPLDLQAGEIRKRLGFKDNQTVIGLLPGSRNREVAYLLPEMLKAAGIMKDRISNIVFAVPVAPTIEMDYIKELIGESHIDIRVFEGETYNIMAASDFILAASGTATLEAALIGTPMLITYRMATMTYIIGRMLVSLKYGGLPNIVAGRCIVPEFIQFRAKRELIAEEAINILKDKARLASMRADLLEIRSLLGSPGAAARAAEAVSFLINKRKPF